MAWFSRFTRFGDAHMVFGQERSISCGLACVIMAAFKVNKLVPGVKAMFDEDTILQKATALLGPNPLGTAGLNNPQILQMLNHPDLNMPGWKLETLPPASVPAKIMQKVGVSPGFGPTVNVTPMVVGIDWTGGGGHWVVVDTVRTILGHSWATVCDPWDSDVHVTSLALNQTFNYTGDQGLKFDFWGTHYEYNTPSVGGAFVGDILYRD